VIVGTKFLRSKLAAYFSSAASLVLTVELDAQFKTYFYPFFSLFVVQTPDFNIRAGVEAMRLNQEMNLKIFKCSRVIVSISKDKIVKQLSVKCF